MAYIQRSNRENQTNQDKTKIQKNKFPKKQIIQFLFQAFSFSLFTHFILPLGGGR
jgi:hypothetical protein